MALDAAVLLERARTQTGLSAFGEAPFLESLERLCSALSTEAGLTEKGAAYAETLLIGHLAERLRLEDFIARHPEALDAPLAPTIFLVGMPRSGTTALAQHLAEDDALRTIPRWESKALTPPERGAHTEADPRVAVIRAEFEQAFKDMPWRQKILPNTHVDPAEHGLLMALTFMNLQWPVMFHVPGWTNWALAQDMTEAYAYLRRVLLVLQWAKPASRWCLKLPPDLFALETIARVFPDAVFVWAHRHPLASISSVSSLCAQLREKQIGARVDPLTIGPEQLAFQALGCDRAMAARALLGKDRFVDVWQSDLGRDMEGTISALYERLGLTMSDAYRASLATRMRDKPRGRFGEHEHDLATYGLDEGAVTARFAAYIARFHRR